jgi:predicted nucleotidyltransferase
MTETQSQQLRETLSAIETALAAETDLHTVILYGSGARGRLRGPGELESDVDVAVASDEELPLERWLDLAGKLGSALRREVDVVDLHRMHGLILREILTAGRFIRKDNPEFIAEKAIEMYDYEIFLEPTTRAARKARINRVIHGGDHTAVTGTEA